MFGQIFLILKNKLRRVVTVAAHYLFGDLDLLWEKKVFATLTERAAQSDTGVGVARMGPVFYSKNIAFVCPKLPAEQVEAQLNAS